MTDQQRFDAMSCHQGWIKTPNLDRLAAGGIDLRGHYAQAPVCVPSRCSLFSGRYAHTHRVQENDARLAAHEVHLFKALKAAGYEMGYFGKNHLLPKEEMAVNFNEFDDVHGASDLLDSAERTAYVKLEKTAIKRLVTVGSYASAEFHDFPDSVTTTGIIARKTRDYLQELPSDRPWCTVTSFYDPHVPHLAPRRFESWYSPESLPLPQTDPEELNTKAPRVKIKQIAQNADRATEQEKRHYMAVYGSMCSYVDEQIGDILETLSHRPDKKRTIVVFVSDHGDFCWNHGLCKKDLLLYDELLHVPAVINWSGQLKPAVIEDTFSEHVDIMPTLLELAGIPVPFGCQGKSMLLLLQGHTSTHKEAIHAEACYPWMRCEYTTHDEFRKAWLDANRKGLPMGHTAPFNVPGDYTKCIRTREWKYIWYGNGFEELYCLTEDPAETVNLAMDSSYSESVRNWREALFTWVVETADPKCPRKEQEQITEYGTWNSCPEARRSW